MVIKISSLKIQKNFLAFQLNIPRYYFCIPGASAIVATCFHDAIMTPADGNYQIRFHFINKPEELAKMYK